MASVFLILLLVICVVAVLAQRTRASYPIAFVLSGMALATLPHFPKFEIPPESILLIFLPPLLTEAAYFTSIRDFRANKGRILHLALGLVAVTAIATAFMSHWLIPEMTLAAGFVLGAIISPPDAIAATSVLQKMHIPRRIVTVLEGESLVNDATGLVLYRFAVAAVVTGSFSLLSASLNFVWMVFAGITIGLAIGWLYVRYFPRIKEMSVEILSTFLVPYASYLAAESVHASGVLAVVTTGLVIGWFGPRIFYPALRIPLEAVWRMVVFVLNSFVFLLIGLQFPDLLKSLSPYSTQQLCLYAAVTSITVIAVRFIYIYTVAYGVRALLPKLHKDEPAPPWQNVFIVAWTGMRGVVSLATALALPLWLMDGSPFPERNLIIFLAFSVILVTLVLQGIPLPWLISKLALIYENSILQEDWDARMEGAKAALERLQALAKDETAGSAAFDRLLSHYGDRIESLGDGPNTPLNPKDPPSKENHPLIQAEHRLWREVLDAERKAVICLRQTFKISDDVMHDRLREIDLLHNRFG